MRHRPCSHHDDRNEYRRSGHRWFAGPALELRALSVPAVAVMVGVVAAAAWWAAAWLRARPFVGGDLARLPVLLVAPLLAAVAVSQLLHLPDPEVRATLPRPRTCWRVTHALLMLVVAPLPLSLAATADGYTWGSLVLVRNTLGCVALVLLTARMLPIGLAAAPAAVWLAAAYAVGPPPVGVVLTRARVCLLWPVQSSGDCLTWVVVGALSVLAFAVSAVRPRTFIRWLTPD